MSEAADAPGLSLARAVALGAVQGPTELLPISSSAHLSLLPWFAGWRWEDGMLPSPQAPVWPMAAFPNRFLTAFGPAPGAADAVARP